MLKNYVEKQAWIIMKKMTDNYEIFFMVLRHFLYLLMPASIP